MLCGEWVPSESKQDIHMNPVHQLTFCEVKSCVFVKNESNIIKAF